MPSVAGIGNCQSDLCGKKKLAAVTERPEVSVQDSTPFNGHSPFALPTQFSVGV